jgi:hypothetical protein
MDKCYLLLLPRELRDEIYSLVVSDAPLTYRTKTNKTTSSSYFYCREPVVAQTCRQIRKESLTLYFKRNRFVFKYRAGLPIAPTAVEHMNHIDIRLTGLRTYHYALNLANGFQACEITLKDNGPYGPQVQRVRAEVLTSIRRWIDSRIASGYTSLTKGLFEDLICRSRSRLEDAGIADDRRW